MSTLNTKILPCDCDHEYQNVTYGNGNRVHNKLRADGNNPPNWRCSVCEKTKDGSGFGGGTKSKKKK